VIGWLRRIFDRHPRRGRVETGIYMGRNTIWPHSTLPPVLLGVRAARRLAIGDRVKFTVRDDGVVGGLHVYRKASR